MYSVFIQDVNEFPNPKASNVDHEKVAGKLSFDSGNH
jgi:hypothetical protein